MITVMSCSRHGIQSDPDATFCPTCGERLTQVEATVQHSNSTTPLDMTNLDACVCGKSAKELHDGHPSYCTKCG